MTVKRLLGVLRPRKRNKAAVARRHLTICMQIYLSELRKISSYIIDNAPEMGIGEGDVFHNYQDMDPETYGGLLSLADEAAVQTEDLKAKLTKGV